MDQEPHIASGRVGAEGWYQDPYCRHEERWFSAGRATALVKDGDTEGHDEVSGPPPGPLVPVEDPGWDHGQDLVRADGVEAESVSAPDLERAGQEDVEADAAAELDVAAGESGAVD
jgi:hypothetical protein